jgi:hypothetical protein
MVFVNFCKTLVLTFSAILVLLSSLPQSPTTITVNPAITYQTIIGWEATAQAGQSDYADWNSYKNNLIDQAVADGVNRLRLEILHSTESSTPNTDGSVNDNADPHVINPAGFQWGDENGVDAQIEIANMLRSRLAAQGETLHVNVCYVDFKSSYTFDHHTNPEEYAELMEALFLRTSQHGWVPDSVELLLEADKASNIKWTLSTATPSGAKLEAVLIATRNRLAVHGWLPRFIAPSPTDCDKADVIYNAMKLANPAIVQFMDELSFHRYTSAACTQAQLDQNKAVAEADGLSLSMLERIGATYITLHTDLKAGAVAWQQYALAYDSVLQGDNGANYYLVNHSNHTATISSRMKFLRQYFKYIRRGAVRISGTSTNVNLDPVAFINAHGKNVVVVKATAGGSFNVAGLASGTYGIKYTTDAQYDVDLPDQAIGVGGIVTTGIPAAGAITIYGITGGSAPTPTPTPAPSPTPPLASMELMLEENGVVANEAAALDSVLFLRDPFPVVNSADLLNLNADRNTRVILFVLNLPPIQPGSVIVSLVDSTNQSHDSPAEEVRSVPFQAFVQVVFRLPDNLPVGLCQVRVKALGQTTNMGVIRIRF